MKREELIQAAAKDERSVSQERAFVRGAHFADEVSRWICVDDEMPPNDEWVIVSVNMGNGHWFTWMACWNGKKWMQRTDIQVGADWDLGDWKIEYWSPIPHGLPRKEKKDENY